MNVTAQVARGGSSEPDVGDQARWVGGQGLQHVPALLSGGREKRADDGEVLAPSTERKPPEIF